MEFYSNIDVYTAAKNRIKDCVLKYKDSCLICVSLSGGEYSSAILYLGKLVHNGMLYQWQNGKVHENGAIEMELKAVPLNTIIR